MANDKNSSGPSGGGTKGHLAKGPASTIGSPPNPKIREAAWHHMEPDFWYKPFLVSFCLSVAVRIAMSF